MDNKETLIAHIKECMETRLEMIVEGDIKLNVSNQFDEYILETAISNIHMLSSIIDGWLDQGVNVGQTDFMVYAHRIYANHKQNQNQNLN